MILDSRTCFWIVLVPKVSQSGTDHESPKATSKDPKNVICFFWRICATKCTDKCNLICNKKPSYIEQPDMNLYHQNNLWSKNLNWKKTFPIEYLGMFSQSKSSSRFLTNNLTHIYIYIKSYLNPGGDCNSGRGSASQNIHSLKLTAKAPENRPKRPKKETRKYSNHPFSGAKSW